MAIWQFSLFLIPSGSIEEIFKEAPSKLSIGVAEDTRWWLGHQPKQGFEDAISQILPESPSWSKSVRIWGTDRGDSILVLYETTEKLEVEEIEVRIDVSKLSTSFIVHACKLITDLGCIARTKTYEIVCPDYFTVEQAIVNSRALQFLDDPESTLRSLRHNEFERNS